MDVKTKKIKLGTILAIIKCMLQGNNRVETIDFYGFLTNGQPLYVQNYSKCLRCGK
jgi:hypothetical protein